MTMMSGFFHHMAYWSKSFSNSSIVMGFLYIKVTTVNVAKMARKTRKDWNWFLSTFKYTTGLNKKLIIHYKTKGGNMLIRAKYFKMIFPPITITGGLTAITYILNTAHSIIFTIGAVVVVGLLGLSPLFVDDKRMKKCGPVLIVIYSILAILSIVFVIYFCGMVRITIAEPLISWGFCFKKITICIVICILPRGGLEPPRPYEHQILSLACLPIPSSGLNKKMSIDGSMFI